LVLGSWRGRLPPVPAPSRILFGSLILGLAVTGCADSGRASGIQGPSTAIRAPLPQVVDDCEHLALRPTQISVACGDGNFTLVEAHYDHWTDAEAGGRAVAVRNDCVPSCAGGHFVDTAVDFRLDGRAVVYGVPVFTRLEVRDARTGAALLTGAPLLPLACTVEPMSCPPTPAP
jgi:hypothetical protein